MPKHTVELTICLGGIVWTWPWESKTIKPSNHACLSFKCLCLLDWLFCSGVVEFLFSILTSGTFNNYSFLSQRHTRFFGGRGNSNKCFWPGQCFKPKSHCSGEYCLSHKENQKEMTAATSHRNVGRALWFLRQQPPSKQAALPCLLNQNPWSSVLATRGRSCCAPDTDHLNVPLILQPVSCRTQRWGVWTSNMDELTAKPDLKVTDPWKKRQLGRAVALLCPHCHLVFETQKGTANGRCSQRRGLEMLSLKEVLLDTDFRKFYPSLISAAECFTRQVNSLPFSNKRFRIILI